MCEGDTTKLQKGLKDKAGVCRMDVTRWREDMNFIFRVAKQCFTNERSEITEITSSINSRVRLWKINHSGPECRFYEFNEW